MHNTVNMLRRIRLYLFDMDGPLYLGDRLYDFTIELLDTLKATGRKFLFMTNNSSKSVEDYIKKLEKLGIAATQEDFITSSQATAYYLSDGNRTHAASLEGWNSTIELHPHSSHFTVVSTTLVYNSIKKTNCQIIFTVFFKKNQKILFISFITKNTISPKQKKL